MSGSLTQAQQDELAFTKAHLDKLASQPVTYPTDFTTPDELKPRKPPLVGVSAHSNITLAITERNPLRGVQRASGERREEGGRYPNGMADGLWTGRYWTGNVTWDRLAPLRLSSTLSARDPSNKFFNLTDPTYEW